jgi:hypothetical protein
MILYKNDEHPKSDGMSVVGSVEVWSDSFVLYENQIRSVL